MKSLFNLTNELHDQLEEIALALGEVNEETENKLDQIQTLLTTKTDNIVGWVQSQNELIDLAKDRIVQLSNFIKFTEEKLDRYDSYVDNCLNRIGTAKIEGNFSVIKKRKPSVVVEILDDRLIPMEFIRIPEPKAEIAKDKIKEALKKGEEVPGATLNESKKISIQYEIKK